MPRGDFRASQLWRRAPSGRCAIAALTVASSLCARARAASETRPPRFQFTAPPACVDEATFRARLGAREASRPDRVPPRSLSIRIVEQEGAVFAGQLSVEHDDGRITTRDVASNRCDDVVDALELVSAIALGLDVSAPSPSPPTPDQASREGPAKPPRPETDVTWRVTGAVYVGAVGGLGPRLAFAPSLSVGVVRDVRGWFAPALEIVGTWAESTTIETALGTASLTLLDAALSGCPMRVSLSDSFALRPCGELQLGTVRANASGPTLVGERTANRPWMAAGALGRLEWRASRSLLVDLQGGANFSLVQDRFFFTPGTTIAEIPSISGAFKLGARFAWP